MAPFIGPRSCSYASTTASIGVGGDEAPLDEQRLDRGDALLDVGERRRMMAVIVIVVIVVVAHSR